VPSFDPGGIFNNVVASALWLVIGLILGGIVEYIRRQRSPRVVWRLSKSERDLSVAISTLQPQETGQYARPTTGLGALIAAASVSESLADAFLMNRPRMHLHFSERFPPNLLRSPLVTIGGPRFNSMSDRQLSSPGLRYSFVVEEPASIRDNLTGATLSAVKRNNVVEKDYALITKTRNPFNDATLAINLAGIHTFGVGAAALMLTKPYIRELAKRVRKLGPDWQVLLEVQVVDHDAFPRILEAVKVGP